MDRRILATPNNIIGLIAAIATILALLFPLPVNVIIKVILIYGFSLIVFVSFVYPVSKNKKPELKILDFEVHRNSRGSFYELIVENNGDDGAEHCEAQLQLDISQDDIAEPTYDHHVNYLITKRNFRASSMMSLRWDVSGKYPLALPINVGGRAKLHFLWLIREPKGLSYIVIPYQRDLLSHYVALTLKEYAGSIRITCMNTNYVERNFGIAFDGKDDIVITLS